MRGWLIAAAAALALGSCATPDRPASLETIAAALADAARPPADRERDAARRSAEVLAFAGVGVGDRVGEYVPGGGYFTRLLAKVVRPEGQVYAYQPREFTAVAPKYLTDIQAVAGDPAYGNIIVLNEATAAFAAPEPLDLVFTTQNYHDMYFRLAPPGTAEAFNRAAFRALKPGGVYLITDHHARAGTGTADANTLHRIDVEAVKREVQAAGFVLEAESDLLRNPDDPRTASVFDPSIRGRTDQFMLKFRKPRR